MERAAFFASLDAERARWDAALAQVDETRLSQMPAAGTWNIKDLVAHVTWFEREMVNLLRERTLAGSDLWNLPQDERNAAIYAQSCDRPPGEVLEEARRVYAELRELLTSVTNEDLTDPGRFRDMPPAWVPWRVLAENTYEHYRDHLTQLLTATE